MHAREWVTSSGHAHVKRALAPLSGKIDVQIHAVGVGFPKRKIVKGEEIYWRFRQDEAREKRDFEYALSLSEATGYPLAEAPNSAGGYKDWCVDPCTWGRVRA